MRVAKCEVKENYESKKIKLSTPQKPENEHDKHHIVGCFQQWPIAEFSGIRRGGGDNLWFSLRCKDHKSLAKNYFMTQLYGYIHIYCYTSWM